MTETGESLREGEAPAPSSLLGRALFTLLSRSPEAHATGLSAGGAALELPGRVTVLLLAWTPDRVAELRARLLGVMRQHDTGPLVCGVVGGGADALRALKGSMPWLTRVKVGLVHVAEDGRIWRKRADALKGLFDELAAPPSEAEWKALLARAAASLAVQADERRETQTFAALVGSRRAVVTWTLAGLITLAFVLEWAFGGTSAAVLLRMGALEPQRVRAGELWRLLSCSFLHADYAHFGFNLYVLIVLGRSLERILGAWRFLLLYGVSCLGASLLSAAHLKGFSVGASGGLWGMLAAEAVLAWRAQGLLPGALVPRARRVATTNLIINVVNSVRPHVDAWAHLGGGVVGGALLLTGALTRGVPRLGELEARGAAAGDPPPSADVPAPAILRASGAAVAAALLLSLGVALVAGRPWALLRPVDLERRDIPALGISLELPRDLPATPGAGGSDERTVDVGKLLEDPGALSVTIFSADLGDAAARAEALESLLRSAGTPPHGASVLSAPRRRPIAGSAEGATVSYRYPNDLVLERSFVVFARAIVRVETLLWPGLERAVPKGYTAAVLDTVRPLPPPPPPSPPPAAGGGR